MPQANRFYKKASPERKLQSVSGELTLARSSSFSAPTSSPGSSSKKGLEGSRGLSALFCYKTEIKFSVFSYFSFLSASWVWALHTKDTLDWFTASYKLFKIKSGSLVYVDQFVGGCDETAPPIIIFHSNRSLIELQTVTGMCVWTELKQKGLCRP